MASLVSRLWMKLCKKRTVLGIMIVGLDNSGKTSILSNLMSFNQPRGSSSSHDSHQRDNKSQSPSSSNTPTATNRDLTRKTAAGDSDNVVSPTVGYNYERIQYKGLALTVLDFSGQNRYRNLWQEFYNCVDAIVFVIDSSDLIRLVVVRDELETLLSHPYFSSLAGEPAAADNNNQLITSDKSTIEQQQQLAPRILAQKQITLDNQGKLVQSPLNDRTALTTTASGRQRIKVPILFLANKSDLANSVDIEVIVRALNLNQLPKSRHPWLIQATSINSNQGIGEGFDWLASQLSTLSTPTPTSSTIQNAPTQ